MAAIVSVVAYVKFYRSEPARVIRLGRRPFPVRFDRHRSGARHPVLDLARAAAHLSGAPAAPGRLRGARTSRAGRRARCRSDFRRSPSAIRASAPTARCAIRPGGANGQAAPPTIVPAGPAHQTGVQEYRRFLIACASDQRFNAATILGEIAKNYRLSLLDRALYRFVIIPFDAAAAPGARARRPMDARADRMGAGPGGCRQRREVLASETPGRQHRRHRRHRSALEPRTRATARRCSGTDRTRA